MNALFKSPKKIILFIIAVAVIVFGIYFVYGVVINTQLSMSSYVPTRRFPTYPTLNTVGKTTQQIAQIKRGEYLTKAGDCIACHTNPEHINEPFAGGLPMQTPFGVIYSRNITPDKVNGIGSWTDQEFLTAFREGKSPKGYYLYPAFPYIYYNKVTDADALAIRAYLASIPAVARPNLENNMLFPFNWRFIQLGWRILFFYPQRTGPYQPDKKQSATWNQGKYLVEGLGHCGMCHTPSYYLLTKSISLGAPIRKYSMTGAVIEGYLAPNISKSNIGAIPDEQLLEVFTQYHLLGGGEVQGPMYEAIHDSLQPLTTTDLLSMITYLKTVDSKIPSQSIAKATDVGKVVYGNYCSGCHNSGVGGAPRIGDALGWQTLENSGLNKLYAVAIYGGGNMPARGTCITCSDYDIKRAVDYIVATSKIPAAQIAPVSSKPNRAEKVYRNNCSSCHSQPTSKAPQLGDKAAWAPIEKKGFINAYQDIMTGENGHPVNGGCRNCTDKDILSALKYMLKQGGSSNNYILW